MCTAPGSGPSQGSVQLAGPECSQPGVGPVWAGAATQAWHREGSWVGTGEISMCRCMQMYADVCRSILTLRRMQRVRHHRRANESLNLSEQPSAVCDRESLYDSPLGPRDSASKNVA